MCVVREEGEDKTRNDKSGSEGSKSDSGDEGRVEDIVDGNSPSDHANAQMSATTKILNRRGLCLKTEQPTRQCRRQKSKS